MIFRWISTALILFCLAFALPALGQPGGQEDERLILAENKFNQQEYGAALKIYLELEEQRPDDPYVKYRIGLCYLISKNQKHKATEYLEYALEHKNSRIPTDLYYYLGRCYHLNYRFDSAIAQYKRYSDSAPKSELKFQDAERQVDMCRNALVLQELPRPNQVVEILNPPINSSYDESSPLIRPNGGLLLFSSDRNTESVDIVFGDRYVFMPDVLKNEHEDIFQSYPRGIEWNYPYPQGFEEKVVMPLSLREQGFELLVYVEDEDGEGELCISKHRGSRWTSPKRLSNRINERDSKIGGACFAQNGKALYFSSNRSGGYGGYDLYVSYEEGRDWGRPINLGPQINTPYDEVNPFMLSDEKSFYFSSNGHNSMGGLDIFKSLRVGENEWAKVKNLGHPINTPYNEDHYVQRTDGKQAFFSSDRAMSGSIGGEDIVGVFRIEKQNPMAIVKGVMTVEKNGRKLPVTLEVFDKQTREKQRYVYNPDDEDNYFMILKPRRTYSVHITAGKEGTTQVMEITIPEDVYSFRLNKRFRLDGIELLGEVVGDRVFVLEDSLSFKEVKSEADIEAARYDALVLLMERIVDARDQQQLTNLNELDQQPLMPSRSAVDSFYTPIISRVAAAFEDQDIDALRNLGKPSLEQEVVFRGKEVNQRKLIAVYKPFIDESGAITLKGAGRGGVARMVAFLQQHEELRLEVSYSSMAESPIQENAERVYQHFKGQKGLEDGRVFKVKTASKPKETPIQLKLFEKPGAYD